jgi:glycosyltransferase involved in cell wall biosynthesis
LHILNTAQPRGTGIAKIVRTIATRIDGEFRTSVWFVYEDGPLVEWFREAGVEARFVPWRPSLKNPAGPLHLLAACRSEQPALVHHHCADARVRWIVRRSVRAPILLHLHGRAAETASPVPVAMSTRYADRVITVSQAVSEFTKTPSEVVYSGIDMGTTARAENRDNEVIVGTAGRLVALKGIDRLLRAFALVRQKYPMARLEIAGEGEERARLEAQAAILNWDGAICFLGWQEDLRSVMRRWSIYLQPSLEEGMPLSILEAMAEGLPVIATAVGGIPEAVIDGESGCLVRCGDEHAMADRIGELVRDGECRRRMGARARELAADRFSADRFVKRIQTIYDEMLRAER